MDIAGERGKCDVTAKEGKNKREKTNDGRVMKK